MDLDKVSGWIESEYQFLNREHAHWSLTKGPQDMEGVARALRVILHLGKAGESLSEYQALLRVQHADGGWGRESTEQESAARVSAFCGLMLIRANTVLKDAEIEKSIWKSIDYFLQQQKENGRWVDSEWGDLDTTSRPVGLFNVVMALGTPKMKGAVRSAWRKGLRFILDGQSADGGWYDPVFQPSGVETTAHLVQDSVIASLSLPDGLPVRPSCEKGLQWILAHQDSDGSWDEKNMDHTMDCTRSILLISRMLGAEEKARPALEKAMEWIVANKNLKGWPDFPGMETNLERTCDGLDVLLKYQAWRQSDPKEVVRRWGYLPGEPTFLRGVTAILLAAGVGKRMGPNAGPKCLLGIGGISLLRRALESLRAVGVQETVLVTGYQHEAVAREARAHTGGMRLTVLSNPRYREGAILSLWTAREFLDRDLLVMDADVLCPQAAFERLVGSVHENCLLADGSVRETGEEQMLFGREGRVLHIAKQAPEEIRREMDLYGESIGFLRLSGAAASVLRDVLEKKVQAGAVTIEHEQVYPDLFRQVRVGCERVDGMAWTEIDTPEDLGRAEQEVYPRWSEMKCVNRRDPSRGGACLAPVLK